MKKLFLLALIAIGMLCSTDTQAQLFKKKKNKKDTEKPAEKKSDFEDLIAKCTKTEGLFTIYQDTATGESYLEIKKEQLGKEFLYFSYIENGVMEAGSFKGAYRGSKVITFDKSFDKIEIYSENAAYYYDEDSPLSKASNTNINRPMIAAEKLKGTNKEETSYLISGDAIFMSEAFQMIKPPSNPMFPSFLGSLNKSKSKINHINNYPENTEIRVSYVYDNKSPKRGGSPAVTDPRYITINYQHSLMQMPDNDFQPRRDDGRLGYFMTQVTDMTTTEPIPYKDMIHRWNLVKKDPGAAMSEPLEPITWWIENTTPLEFRDIIKEGVERWNTSFEKAGFKNAVVVNVQPDDADWDAGDIRYNVLRWTSSPFPPFGGYGPSFVNPRTGEILGADIMLEFVSVSRRLFVAETFEKTATITDDDFETEFDQSTPYQCEHGEHLHNNMLFGLSSARAMGLNKVVETDIISQTLYRLVLHEVGHTLGLTHNMRASTMLTLEEVKTPAIVEEKGLCNSVMEYPSINFSLEDEDQSLFYDVKPGPYDDWVIEYGYSEADANADSEEERLTQILSRSTEPDLMYGNDADDMRGTGRGFDPDVNIYDLSSDPVQYAIDRCELVKKTIPNLMNQYSESDQPYSELLYAYQVMTGEYGTQLRIMTRQIGGVHYDRAYPGQNSKVNPLVPVDEATQRKAMDALMKYAFDPKAWEQDEELLQHLLPQRRGFNHFVVTQDPKIHGRILMLQGSALSHFMNSNVMNRIVDSELYGNTYSLSEVYNDLTDGIFKADLKGNVNTVRQNLQSLYVTNMIKMMDSKRHTHHSKAVFNYQLSEIEKMMKNNRGGDASTKAHRLYLVKLINDYKEA